MGKVFKCCTQFWRWLFIVLNIIFFVIGLALIAVGIWLLVSDQDYSFITDTIYASPAALLIVAGVITLIISFVGILGAAGMWYIVLIIYISFMVVIVILQIVAGILGVVFQDRLVEIVEDRVSDAVTDYRLNSSSSGYKSDVNNFIDFVQESFDCCGYSSSAEWKTTVFFNESNGQYPESCECMVQDCGKCAPPPGSGERCNDSVPVNDSLEQYIWVEGCNSSVVDQLEDNLGIIAGVGVAFGLFEISGVAVALGLCICACVRRGKEDDIELDDYVY